MLALTPAEAGFLLTFVCLALAALLVWACYDAERPSTPFWLQARILTRSKW